MRIIWFWEKTRKVIYRHDDDGSIYFAHALYENSKKEEILWHYVSQESNLYSQLIGEVSTWYEVKEELPTSIYDICWLYPEAARPEKTKYFHGEWNHITLIEQREDKDNKDVYGYYYGSYRSLCLDRGRIKVAHVDGDCDDIDAIENLYHSLIFFIEYPVCPL
jgi:hypothetical protein